MATELLKWVIEISHPWELIKEELDSRNITQKDFAKVIWKTTVEVNQLINWRRDIDVDWSIRVSLFLWMEREVWYNYQWAYNAYKMKKKNEEFYKSIKQRNHDTRTKGGNGDLS